MCGIFCVVDFGKDDNASRVVELIGSGLSRLEYRGYDSCGMAIVNSEEVVKVFKSTKGIDHMLALSGAIESSIGIGHTRWATHGKVSLDNTHPHHCNDIYVVHNGIVENKQEVINYLSSNNCKYKLTDSDTAIIPVLINYLMEANKLPFFEAFNLACTNFLSGSSAIVAMNNGSIATFKKNAPLFIVHGGSENYVITSDVCAVDNKTDDIKYHQFEDGESIFLGKDGFVKSVKNHLLSKPSFEVCNEQLNYQNIDFEEAMHTVIDAHYIEQKEYSHLMQKEIYEQPDLLQKTLLTASCNGDEFSNVERIFFVGCGSSYNVGQVLASALSYFSQDIEGTALVASEVLDSFAVNQAHNKSKILFIFISQSGETMDAILAIKLLKSYGFKIGAILNRKKTTMEKLVDWSIFCYTTQEIAVAATKSFTAQLLAGLMLIEKNIKNEALATSILACPEVIRKQIFNVETKIIEIAKKLACANGIFFAGRGLAFSLCCEGSLKMKEVSYIHSEAVFAGELKHGHIAMIDDTFFTVAFLLKQDGLCPKTLSNLEEIMARGGHVIAIGQKDIVSHNSSSLNIFFESEKELGLIEEIFASTVVLQLLAYHVASVLSLPIDKPRNLAKSVTVE